MASSIALLLARLDAREDDHFEPGLALRGLAFVAFDTVVLDLVLETCGAPAELFRIVARGVADLRIRSTPAEPIRLLSEDPRLREFSEPWAELTFNGKPSSVLQLLGALWTAHDGWCGPTLPFGTFLNLPDRLEWLVAGGYGQLARGPRSFIDSLHAVLTRFEISSTVLPIPGSEEWALDGIALLRFGESFIVARTFSVEPIHPSRAIPSGPHPALSVSNDEEAVSRDPRRAGRKG